ncbi:MAG TPA: ATP-binding protein [Ilumatobacteraceae bacterium]
MLSNTLHVELPRQSTAPRLARRAIAAYLGDGFPPEVAETLLLIGNELVTNAIRHTSGGCVLSLRVDDTEVVVEVHDNDVPLPETTQLEDQLSRRGLGIVQSMATRWGIERHPDGGKLVWAEVLRTRP